MRWRLRGFSILALALVGCDLTLGGGGDAPVRVLSVAVRAEAGPIFRTLAIELDRPARLAVDYWASGTDRLRVETSGAAAVQELFLPRLRASTQYSYEVRELSAEGEEVVAGAGTFATDALPAQLANLRFAVSGDAGFDLLLLEIGRPADPQMPVIVDTHGNVVWYSLREGWVSSGFTVFEDSLFAMNTPTGLRVVSPRSQQVVMSLTRARAAQRTGIDPFFIHHDVIATRSGTLLFLVHDTVTVGGSEWTGEAVWEWNPRTDNLVRRWSSGDFLDPGRDVGLRSTRDDWLHANSLALGPRGNILVSFFWLHEVLSITPDWDRVEWRLGGPASSFEGVESELEAGQHTAAEVAPDHLLLFDNGLDRSAGRFSRALEVRLDRVRGVAELVWEFQPSPPVFAPIVSSARRLPGGSTVVGFGLAAGFMAEGTTATGPVVIYEVGPAGDVLWRMEVVRGADLVYRSTPLSSVAGEQVIDRSSAAVLSAQGPS